MSSQSSLHEDAPTKSKPLALKKKVNKPYRVEWRSKGSLGAIFKEWSTYSRYKTLEMADQNIKAAQRKHGDIFQFRIRKP